MPGIGIGLSSAFGTKPLFYLLRDEFTDTLAAGAVNGTAATPGPGTRAVVDTGSNVSLSSDKLVFANRVASGDPRYALDKQTQAAGLAAFCLINSGIEDVITVGWDNASSGPMEAAAFRYNASNVLKVYIHSTFLTDTLGGHKNGTGVVLRSTGAFFIVDDDGTGDWKLWWVDNVASPGADSYPGISARASSPSPQFDWFRVAQLSPPWNSDNGIATDDNLSGARGAGDTFTHEADCLIEFEVTTVPSGNQIELEFRQQTTNTDCWRVTIDSAGDIDLDEIVATVVTQRGTSAAAISNGDRVIIVCDDETINVYGDDGSLLITYSSAANYKTETDGELETEGTAGSVSDIISWPRTLSGAALSSINSYTA